MAIVRPFWKLFVQNLLHNQPFEAIFYILNALK